jgi:hypothetical protein
MQPTAAIIDSAKDLERDCAWLVMADRHWSAGTITADEFARYAVGRLLLQDIATAPPTGCDAAT